MRIFSGFCIALVRLYRFVLSPILFSLGVRCRFTPTCSQFTLEALQIHGSVKGCLLSAGRLLRCHPFCEGGHDPVPKSLVHQENLGHG